MSLICKSRKNHELDTNENFQLSFYLLYEYMHGLKNVIENIILKDKIVV